MLRLREHIGDLSESIHNTLMKLQRSKEIWKITCLASHSASTSHQLYYFWNHSAQRIGDENHTRTLAHWWNTNLLGEPLGKNIHRGTENPLGLYLSLPAFFNPARLARDLSVAPDFIYLLGEPLRQHIGIVDGREERGERELRLVLRHACKSIPFIANFRILNQCDCALRQSSIFLEWINISDNSSPMRNKRWT